MTAEPSPKDCTNWINQNIELVRTISEKGYVDSGRGCLAIEFFEKDGWQCFIRHCTLDELLGFGLSKEFVEQVREMVDMYEPDSEAAFYISVRGKILGEGILDFWKTE